jgi:DNA (cytosine-5)-methyltransferase 1
MADACREQAHEEQQRPEPDERERGSNSVGGCGVDYGQSDMADAEVNGLQKWKRENRQQDARGISESWLDASRNNSFWSDHIWLTGADGKARRAKPGVPLLAHGVSARVGRLRAYGNAIVPQLAAEVIGAYMECRL